MDQNLLVSPTRGTDLFWIKSKPFLFVAESQQVFGASAFTAELWDKLKPGLSVGRIDAEAEAFGGDGRETLSMLLEIGAVEMLSVDGDKVPVTSEFFLDLGVCTIRVSFSGERTFNAIRNMFSHIACQPSAFDEHLIVIDDAQNVLVGPAGESTEEFDSKDAGAAVKAAVTDFVHDQARGVLLHVATITDDGAALLLVGDPGAGKSTLAVALGASGFALEGDDIAELCEDGSVRAVPFPATLKRGSVPLISDLVPSVLEQPENLRSDNQYARYLPLDLEALPRSRPVRCVLSLLRDDTREKGLEPLTPEQILGSLIQGGWTADERMDTDQFQSLARCVDGAVGFEVTYSDLDSGLALAKEAWQRAGSQMLNTAHEAG